MFVVTLQLQTAYAADRCWTVRVFDRPGSEEDLRIPAHAGYVYRNLIRVDDVMESPKLAE